MKRYSITDGSDRQRIMAEVLNAPRGSVVFIEIDAGENAGTGIAPQQMASSPAPASSNSKAQNELAGEEVPSSPAGRQGGADGVVSGARRPADGARP